MKVVLDTNVIISGLLWKGNPSKILDLGKAGFFEIGLTPKLVQEVEKVLDYQRLLIPLTLTGQHPDDIIESLEKTGVILPDPQNVKIIKEDSTDNIILGAAVIHNVDYIVSGDNHLLKLKIFLNIPILSPTQFLRALKN